MAEEGVVGGGLVAWNQLVFLDESTSFLSWLKKCRYRQMLETRLESRREVLTLYD